MFCPKCGKEFEENAKFCNVCGEKNPSFAEVKEELDTVNYDSEAATEVQPVIEEAVAEQKVNQQNSLDPNAPQIFDTIEGDIPADAFFDNGEQQPAQEKKKMKPWKNALIISL